MQYRVREDRKILTLIGDCSLVRINRNAVVTQEYDDPHMPGYTCLEYLGREQSEWMIEYAKSIGAREYRTPKKGERRLDFSKIPLSPGGPNHD